ncbi:MSHA biogenesis protein MshQ [Vibrio metschnikovii]|nr:MSHA biogenesis protein MshQ [Vibrio metschnikovii]EKO3660717.1 MSHA biogenesis protein MshQ [Vibrio metschnikovii]
MLAVLLSSFKVAAQQYNLSNGQYPPCSTSWQQSGSTYTCIGGNGRVTLNDGDIIIADQQSTIVARAGFSLTNNVIGMSSTKINLESNHGELNVSSGQSVIYGNFQGNSTNVNGINVSIYGDVITGGVVNLSQAAVFGNVISSNNAINLSYVNITGDITANSGNITISDSSIAGSISTLSNSVTLINTNAHGNIQSHSGLTITGGTYSGNIQLTSANPVVFNSVNMVSGQVAGSNVFTSNNSQLGTPNSPVNINTSTNEINLIGTIGYGDFITPSYSQVNISNSYIVGQCLPISNPANACHPRPAAKYHFDESTWTGNANEVKNSFGDFLHGRAFNGATTGKLLPALPNDTNNYGSCAYGIFNKSNNQYVEVPYSSSLDFEDAVTVSAWVYPTSYPSSSGLMSIVSKDGNYEFHLDSLGRVYWYWERAISGNRTLISNVSIPLNQWSHITIRYDRNRSNQRQAIFINGQLNSSSNHNERLRTNNRPLQIAQDQNTSGRAFDGYIDEVTIYGQGLLDEQIWAEYQSRHLCEGNVGLQCFSDDFENQPLSDQWRVFRSSGAFTPSKVIVNGNNRLRLTQAVQNQATASTFQRIFPAANNRVEVEFDYFAYGGTGADGVAIVFSDAAVTPQVGAFGGPLGYGYKVAEQQPGFAGGWLGIGLDEYGNYSVEGGGNSVNSRRRQAVVLRGSGAGYSGYNYLAGTCNNGSTNINSDCLSPKVDNTNGNPQHRYRIVIDSTQASTSFVTVSRKVGTSSWVDLIGPINVMSLSGQENVPNELFMSITGSTGSVTNNHEIDNFEVCALNSRPVGQQIDHFRMDLPAQGLTCKASEVTVTACANSNCSEIFTDPVTAFLTPSSAPSASGGWLNGPSLALTNGVGVSQLRKNSVSSTNRVNVGISGSNPTAIAFNPTLCRRGGGVYSSTACYVDFVDSGFEIQVPHAYANQLVTGTITALSKGDNPEQCIPSFAGVDKDVSLWSEYLIPSGGQGFSEMNVVVDGSAISNNIAAPSHRSLYFDQSGQAEFELTYREAGSLALHARFTGSGDEQDLQLTGQANFIRVPRALLLSANHSYDLAHPDGKCSAADLSCSVFARAGEGFNLNIKAVAAEPNEDNDFTNNLGLTNYQQQNIILNHTLVEPSNGSAGSIGTLNYHHELGSFTTVQQSVHEVGVFDFSLVPPTSYLGLDLIDAGLPIAVTSTGPIGRFIPAYFAVSPMTVTLAAACSTGGQPFTYLGQPFAYANNPGLYLQPKSGSGSDTLNYLIGDWWRYDNDWENREYINNINSLTVEKISLNANVIRQPSLGSGVILNGEQLRYQKTIDPMLPFNADFNLHLSINDLRDSDDVCYRTSYSESCLEYTFENIDQTMPLYWGRLTIEDVFGPETQGLEQPIYVEHYTSNGFVRTTEDNCTALPAITGFILQSDDYVVVTEGSAVPPQVLAEHTAGNFAQGKRIVRFSAPGADVRGVIDTMLNLDTHNLMWLAEPDDEKNLEEQPWQYYFKDSTQGQVQFGLYRGNDRVIWWRETN